MTEKRMNKVSDEQLKHGRNCPSSTDVNGYDVNGEDCTCGLRFRIELIALRTAADAMEKALESAHALNPRPMFAAALATYQKVKNG